MINTESYSRRIRARIIRPESRQVLVARVGASDQVKDLKKGENCEGLGRVRLFRRGSGGEGWPLNPLPIEPALAALGRQIDNTLRVQIFQNAGCNWRCWYCYVPFPLLDGREDLGAWLSADQLLDLYLAEPDGTRAAMIDLSGGQPDLTPEWVAWTMEAARARGLEGTIYLWSDDNLSTDYYWTHLSDHQRELIGTFRGYGRVACFKGFDRRSFAFNTKAAEELFDRQFELFGRLSETPIDLYAYVTLTGDAEAGIVDKVRAFVDRLQDIYENLPLRTVPLRVNRYSVVTDRLSGPLRQVHEQANLAIDVVQLRAIEAWTRELEDRFSAELRSLPITEVPHRR